MKLSTTIIAAALAISLAGCGGGGDGSEGTIVARDGDTTVTQGPNGSATVTTPEGTADIRSGGNVTELPGGLPPYPGAQAASSVNFNGNGGGQQGRVVIFTTAAQPAQVIDFYVAAARQAGLEEASRTTDRQSSTLALTRGEEQVTIVVMDLGESRQVQISSGG